MAGSETGGSEFWKVLRKSYGFLATRKGTRINWRGLYEGKKSLVGGSLRMNIEECEGLLGVPDQSREGGQSHNSCPNNLRLFSPRQCGWKWRAYCGGLVYSWATLLVCFMGPRDLGSIGG